MSGEPLWIRIMAVMMVGTVYVEYTWPSGMTFLAYGSTSSKYLFSLDTVLEIQGNFSI